MSTIFHTLRLPPPSLIRLNSIVAVLVFQASSLLSQAASYPAAVRTDSAKANYSVYGVWRGQMDGLPAITLVVTDEPGSLSGAIQFYFLQRKTEKNPWTAEPRAPEPIFNVTFDGETLLFEVSHRRAHPPQSLNDPPKHYRLKLNGPNTAEGVNLDESGPALKLVRSDY